MYFFIYEYIKLRKKFDSIVNSNVFLFRSVSPLNFSSAPHRLSSKSSGLSTPGQPPPPSSVHASARSRGIPVRSGSAANSSVSAASSTVVSRAGSTGDTSPRSCSSKESTPSPFHSPRNSLYVSSSSSCAVSPTGGIFTANGGGGTPRISSVYDEDEAELNEEAYFESKRSSGMKFFSSVFLFSFFMFF